MNWSSSSEASSTETSIALSCCQDVPVVEMFWFEVVTSGTGGIPVGFSIAFPFLVSSMISLC